MNAPGPDTYREGTLRLRRLPDEHDLLHIECAGDICLPDFQSGDDPLAGFLGDEVYSRKVLLNLEKASLLDTTGVSWLVSSHDRFQAAGGRLILHSIPPRVGYVLELLNMEQVLPLAADLAAARARATRGTP